MKTNWRTEHQDEMRRYRREWYYRNRHKVIENPDIPLKKHQPVVILNLVCFGCGKEFQRKSSQVRSKSMVFCSWSCCKGVRPDAMAQFKAIATRVWASCKRKTRNLVNETTAENLKELWQSQNGICPYSGRKMTLPKNRYDHLKSPFAASLDRIDSSIGYVMGNVEFVCRFVNYGKSAFSKKDIMEFFRPVANEDATDSKPE